MGLSANGNHSGSNGRKGETLSGLVLTCHSLMHMTIPTFASGTRVQTGLLLGSSTILICRKGSMMIKMTYKKTLKYIRQHQQVNVLQLQRQRGDHEGLEEMLSPTNGTNERTRSL